MAAATILVYVNFAKLYNLDEKKGAGAKSHLLKDTMANREQIHASAK